MRLKMLREVRKIDLPELRDDYGEETLRVVFEWLKRLRDEPFRGKPLERNLTRCFKLYVDPDDEPRILLPEKKRRPGGARLRIVYDLLPNADDPDTVRVISIGVGHAEQPGQDTAYDKADWRIKGESLFPYPQTEQPARKPPGIKKPDPTPPHTSQ